MDQAQVEAIKSWPTPTTITEVEVSIAWHLFVGDSLKCLAALQLPSMNV